MWQSSMTQCFSLDLMDVSLSLDSRVSILQWVITGRGWQSQQYRYLYILCTFLRHYMAVLESLCVCEWVNLLRLKWQDGHLFPEGFPRVVTLDLKTTIAFNYWLKSNWFLSSGSWDLITNGLLRQTASYSLKRVSTDHLQSDFIKQRKLFSEISKLNTT